MTQSKNDISKSGDAGRLVFAVTLSVSAAVLWILLAFRYSDVLLKIESRSLFLSSSMYFLERFQCAGGLLTYIACFLTLSLHYPIAGALVTVLLWSGAAVLTRRVFKLEGAMSALAFIPAALLVAADVDSGYMIFEYRAQGWFFVPTLGYLAALGATYFFEKAKGLGGRIAFIVIWAAAGYPLLGFYALLGLLAIAAGPVASSKVSGRAICLSVSLASLIVFPLIWSGMVLYTGRVADSYIAGLTPIFDDFENFHILWIPFILLTLATAALAYCGFRSGKGGSTSKTQSGITFAVQYASAFAAALVIVLAFWYRDPDFIPDLSMDSAVERHDWKAVVRLHEQVTKGFEKHNERVYQAREKQLQGASDSRTYNDVIKEFKPKFNTPTRAMVMYKNLALLRMGTSGQQAFKYADGDHISKGAIVFPLTVQCGKQLYYNYGLVNFCYRWCLEDAVEYGWNIENLKYAVRSTLIAQDWKIAEKYISKLEDAPIHRKWAKEQRKYLYHPELLKESDEYRDVLPMLCTLTQSSSDESLIEKFLLMYFSRYNLAGATPEGCEASMLWAMQTQDIQTFWNQLAKWIYTHPSEKLPLYYQEAAYLYGNLENGRGLSGIVFSPEVTRKFNEFMQFTQRHPVHSIDEMSYLYQKNFGDTFYYYYYFVRNMRSH